MNIDILKQLEATIKQVEAAKSCIDQKSVDPNLLCKNESEFIERFSEVMGSLKSLSELPEKAEFTTKTGNQNYTVKLKDVKIPKEFIDLVDKGGELSNPNLLLVSKKKTMLEEKERVKRYNKNLSLVADELKSFLAS